MYACATTSKTTYKTTKRQFAIHLLSLEYAPVVRRGNQVDVLIPTSYLFNLNSTNMSSQAPYILSPLYHLIKMYDVDTVSIQAIMPTPAMRDSKLLTRARAGIVGQHLWFDGLQKQLTFIYGGLKDKNLPVSNFVTGVTSPTIWVHWRFYQTHRKYD